MESATKEVPAITIDVDFEDGGRYSLPEGYKPKVSPEQMIAIRQNVLQTLVSRGVPLNEQGMQQANEMIIFNVETLCRRDIYKTLISDAVASAKQQVYAELNTNKKQ